MIDNPLFVVIGAVLLVAGLWLMFGGKQKETQEQKQEPSVSTSTVDKVDEVVQEPVVARATQTSQRRKLKVKRSRPSKNHRYHSRHGYNEDYFAMEDVLFWLWLLDDDEFIWGEAAEYDIEGVDGLSYIAYDGQGIQFFDEDGVEAMLVHSVDDDSYHVEVGSAGEAYDVNTETDTITLVEDGEHKTFVINQDGDWEEVKTEPSSHVMEEVSETVEDVVVEDSGLSAAEVATAAVATGVVVEAATSVAETSAVEEVVVETGSDSASDSNSSVDSDTSY